MILAEIRVIGREEGDKRRGGTRSDKTIGQKGGGGVKKRRVDGGQRPGA